MKRKNIFFLSLFSVLLIFYISQTDGIAKEGENPTVEEVGGWSEETGYWENSSKFKVSNKPQKHRGVITQKFSGGVIYSRITAYTEWKDVRHYSRARFEGVFGVEGDSGRVYGVGKTTAKSGWVDKFLSVGKTYWGR